MSLSVRLTEVRVHRGYKRYGIINTIPIPVGNGTYVCPSSSSWQQRLTFR
jgi:hypothetical protein